MEGTTVYNPQGNNIGSIKRLMIEKISGRVGYAVLSFGGFLGMGEDEHSIPWSKLTYDTSLGGYRTDITEDQLRGHLRSRVMGPGTGATGNASGNCTIITARATTGTSEISVDPRTRPN